MRFTEDEYAAAVALVKENRKVSVSFLNRKMQIGMNRAADIIARMEQERLVTPPNMAGRREVLIPQE